MAEERFGNMARAVVGIEKEIIAVDAELPADEEAQFWKMVPTRIISGAIAFILKCRITNGSNSIR